MMGMQDTASPSVRNRRLGITCNLVAAIAITIGGALFVRAIDQGITLGPSSHLDPIAIGRKLQARATYLWSWPILGVAAAALAARQRWISSMLFFISAPLAAWASASSWEGVGELTLLAGLAIWVSIERNGSWAPLADMLKRRTGSRSLTARTRR